MNKICPQYLQNYFIFTNSKPSVEMVRKTFPYSWAAIWNSLPHDIKKNATSIKTVKSR